MTDRLVEGDRVAPDAASDHSIEESRRTCGAHSRRTGGPCQRVPVAGRTRCRAHGGASLRGAASATFKTGRRGRFLPRRLRERYEQALDDPTMLELRDEIALVDARLSDLL